MNVKLHTPKTLRAGSGMSSLKQFLLSLLATTVSIVLTFGTAAIIDNHKKNAAKKEMVMMVISDMDQTINILQASDSALRDAKRLQMELVSHPERFDSLRVLIPAILTWAYEDFSETTEKIFTTSIETFNTIGDVNFVNTVSSFYMSRHQYKELVLEPLREDLEKNAYRISLKDLMNVSFPDYVCDNWVYLEDLKDRRDACMRMMDVTEKDMIKFNTNRKLEVAMDDDDDNVFQMIDECDSCNKLIKQAREKLKD